MFVVVFEMFPLVVNIRSFNWVFCPKGTLKMVKVYRKRVILRRNGVEEKVNGVRTTPMRVSSVLRPFVVRKVYLDISCHAHFQICL
jgi:hypothetical protein